MKKLLSILFLVINIQIINSNDYEIMNRMIYFENYIIKGKVKILKEFQHNFINEFGKVKFNDEKFLSNKAVFDLKGKLIEETIYISQDNKRYYLVKYSYEDNNGDNQEELIERTVFNSDGSIYEKYKYKNDKIGNIYEILKYSSNSNSPYIYKNKYNDKNYKIETITIDEWGRPAYKYDYNYDNSGNMIEGISYYDSKGVKIDDKFFFKYDTFGNIIEKIKYDSYEDSYDKEKYKIIYDKKNNIKIKETYKIYEKYGENVEELIYYNTYEYEYY